MSDAEPNPPLADARHSREREGERLPSLEMTIQPGGRGDSSIVVASFDDNEIHRDQLNVNRADARSKFARTIAAKLPRFKPAEIDSQLLQLRSDLERSRQREQQQATERCGEEVDAGELTRPELMIRRGYVAMAVPRLMQSHGGPAGALTLYANSGGKRSASELEPSVIVGSRSLHVHPMPMEPSVADVSQLNVWSRRSRNAWLEGKHRPTTAAAFMAVIDRIDRYIELPSDDETESVAHAATLAL